LKIDTSHLPHPLIGTANTLLDSASQSLPEGWQLQTSTAPTKIQLITFHVPATGRTYATVLTPCVVRGTIIKPAAGQESTAVA